MVWRVTALFLTVATLVWSVFEILHDRLPRDDIFASTQLRRTF